MIVGDIRLYLRDNTSIRVSRSLKDTAYKALAAEDEKLFIWNIKKAKSMLEELMNALDFNYPQVTNTLMSLYLFIQSRFNKCIFKKQDVNLDVVVRIVDKLQAGFAEVAKEDTTGPVMENTSAVYAGITYGKGTLNEMYEEKSGFRVYNNGDFFR